MSTTSPTPTIGHVSPQRAFDRIVWHNDRVCNGCFEHVREIDKTTFSGGVYDHDVEDRHRTPQASLEQGVVSHDEYGETNIYQTFDWTRRPSVRQYYALYRTHPFAGPIVDRPAFTTWRDAPISSMTVIPRPRSRRTSKIRIGISTSTRAWNASIGWRASAATV